MTNIDERAAALLKSPLGCAFLWRAEATGLTAEEIAEPINTLYLGAEAAILTEVWRTDRDEILKEVLQRGPQHADLARALLEEPATGWFSSLDRVHQVWVPRDGTPPDSARLITPVQPPSHWERYAQKAAGAFYTSTFIQGTSSMFATIDGGVGDIRVGYAGPPYPFWLLMADASAQVFEIDGPLAWHNLCVSYPADGGTDRGTPDFSGDKGRLVPDWSAVAADWHAVHLTFGGWLTAEQVRVESSSGWTYHWAWDAEQTMWFRWRFTSSERLPDHQRVSPPLERRSTGPLLSEQPSPSIAPLRRFIRESNNQ
jgi:hypothetical protein